MTEVVLEQKPQMAAVSAFGKRNANKEKIEQEEAELKKLLNGEQEENKDEGNAADDANLSAEERTFKKRYGDLRRHSQQQQTQLQSQIDELKAQLQKSTENQIKLPKSEEELAEWAKQYPDVAKIVESIAIKKAREQAEEIDKRLKSLDERELQSAKEKAEMELLKLHPDFDSIRDDDSFHDWVDAQPKWIQQALYENDTDYVAAARAIDLYKADMAKSKKSSSRSDNRDAAQSVSTRSGRSAPAGEDIDGVFYESQVDKMTAQQYEANMEAIQKAIKNGKFVYDLSGSAR
jgi:DNA repair exonuclease SbcCD ATPase subunit